MANWATVQNLGDPMSPGWQDQNLTWIEPVPGQRWQVYAPAADAFTGLLKELHASGYPLQSSGGFNYRNIRGGNRLSQHAFGTAIDLNSASNPMLKSGQKVVTDLPPNVSELAAKYGLEWGGNWKRPDAMHFEWTGGKVTPVQSAQPTQAAQPSALQQPAPGQNLANLYAQAPAPVADSAMAGAPTGPFNPLQVADASPAGLGALFMQQQVARRDKRKEEQEAEALRKAALFGPSPYG